MYGEPRMHTPLDRRDLIGIGIVVLMAVVTAAVYAQLPEQVAIHFDDSGQPDNFLAKPLGVALLPAVGVGVVLLFRLLPAVDPLGANVSAFRRYYDLLAVVTVAVLAYTQGLVLAYNLGYRFDVLQATVPVLTVVYYVAGLVVENAEQNWFVGIRTPWTLSDEEVWNRTHERSGILFKLAGLVALPAILFPEYFIYLAVGPVAAAALLSTTYSFVLYRRKQRGELR